MAVPADIILDSRLATEFLPSGVFRHTIFKSDRARRQRQVRYAETWTTTKKLGEGGFGKVWLQQDESGAVRALKEIRKDHASAPVDYRRELEAAFKFSHGRYVHCFVESFGWFEDEGNVYISMEYLQHGDLRDILGNTTLPEPEVQLISHQIVEGLEFMHSNHFVHRDLKPANILVVEPGPAWWVKMGDFGISKRASEATALRTAIGTIGYLAPEVPIGHETSMSDDSNEESYTAAVDMWALGEIIYRLLTQRPAFPSQREISLFVAGQKTLNVQPLIDRGTTEACQNFIKQLLVAEPSERSSSASAASHQWLRETGSGNELESEYLVRLGRCTADHEHAGRQISPAKPDDQVPEPTADWSTQGFDSAQVQQDATTVPTAAPPSNPPQDPTFPRPTEGSENGHPTIQAWSSMPEMSRKDHDTSARGYGGLKERLSYSSGGDGSISKQGVENLFQQTVEQMEQMAEVASDSLNAAMFASNNTVPRFDRVDPPVLNGRPHWRLRDSSVAGPSHNPFVSPKSYVEPIVADPTKQAVQRHFSGRSEYDTDAVLSKISALSRRPYIDCLFDPKPSLARNHDGTRRHLEEAAAPSSQERTRTEDDDETVASLLARDQYDKKSPWDMGLDLGRAFIRQWSDLTEDNNDKSNGDKKHRDRGQGYIPIDCEGRFSDAKSRFSDAKGRFSDAKGRFSDAKGRFSDAKGRLPAGWERRISAEGIDYYVDHNLRFTSWVRPSSLDGPLFTDVPEDDGQAEAFIQALNESHRSSRSRDG